MIILGEIIRKTAMVGSLEPLLLMALCQDFAHKGDIEHLLRDCLSSCLSVSHESQVCR